jgi:hypothetical protein
MRNLARTTPFHTVFSRSKSTVYNSVLEGKSGRRLFLFSPSSLVKIPFHTVLSNFTNTVSDNILEDTQGFHALRNEVLA